MKPLKETREEKPKRPLLLETQGTSLSHSWRLLLSSSSPGLPVCLSVCQSACLLWCHQHSAPRVVSNKESLTSSNVRLANEWQQVRPRAGRQETSNYSSLYHYPGCRLSLPFSDDFSFFPQSDSLSFSLLDVPSFLPMISLVLSPLTMKTPPTRISSSSFDEVRKTDQPQERRYYFAGAALDGSATN